MVLEQGRKKSKVQTEYKEPVKPIVPATPELDRVSQEASEKKAAEEKARREKAQSMQLGVLQNTPTAPKVSGGEGGIDNQKAPGKGLLDSDKPTDTEALQGVVTEGETAAQNAGNTADARTQAIQDALKDRYGAVEDYYSGSMSDAWKSLNPTDKKILLLDQLGTTLKNVSKARLPMYSAYGRNYEGEGFGDEKSMLQKTMEDSLQKGLDRRNARLDSQMQKQLQVANFPADLEMQLTGMWESGKMSNRQKVHLIKMMSNVNFVDALKAGAVSIAANGGIIDKASGALLGRL